MADTDLHALRVKILTKVMGWEYDPAIPALPWKEPPLAGTGMILYHDNCDIDPTTDLNAAFEALEAWVKSTGQLFYVGPCRDPGLFGAYSSTEDDYGGPLYFAYAASPALAICRVLEQAIGGKEAGDA